MIICVDFDGTCVTHEYPKIGKEIGATPILERLADAGHKIILFTMRSGKELEDAVAWFAERDIPLFGINENPEQKSWTSSPKPYAHMYIDDAGMGCPLIYPLPTSRQRPYVNWTAIEITLKVKGLI